ncbi:hypothetical protein M0802_014202 [Mischocyttarus mexicanus]|nr:hypothetical protein M0802_014202 [Mischocyttarus mexicanus]
MRIPNEDKNQNDEEQFVDTRTFLRHLKKNNCYCNKEAVSEVAKRSIIKLCAEILQDEVKKVHYDTTVYPKSNKFLDNVVSDVPPLFITFLNKLMCF